MGADDYRATIEWMDAPVTTLADIWPAQPRAMVVGLNPAPVSVEAGHYYQGRTGQRQMGRLAAADVFEPPRSGTFYEETALSSGIGFTDIVKRPTSGEKDVGPDELRHGQRLLARELEARGVGLIVCVFRHPVIALRGAAGPPGFQKTRTTWGAEVFRMPGPFAPAPEATAAMQTLRERLRGR